MNEFKDCPFCGYHGEKIYLVKEENKQFLLNVYCTECGASGGPALWYDRIFNGKIDDAKQQAKDKWNKRVPEPSDCYDCKYEKLPGEQSPCNICSSNPATADFFEKKVDQ